MMLNEIKPNQNCQIIKIDTAIKQRLLDLGLIEGSTITKVLENKGMDAYEIKGSIIALRKKDTNNIEVNLI